MELKQLEVFVYVVKLNSFSKAADTIFLSQPTISAHISSLEKELGVQLLIRSTKKVYPTKVGTEFFVHAQNMLALRDQAIHSIREQTADSKGEIMMVASSVPAQYLLPEMIANFNKNYPKILIHVHQSDSEDVEKKLNGCHYDFGIIGTEAASSKFMQRPFYQDTLVFVYPGNMHIDRDAVYRDPLAFLKSHPFVMREVGSGTLKELEKYLMKINGSINDLKSACYFSNTHGVMNAVANGMGISFVSKAAAARYVEMGLVHTIEIESNFFHRWFSLLWKKEMILSPLQNLFQSFILKYYNETNSENLN